MKAVTVSEYMTRQLVTFTPETSLYEAMGVDISSQPSGTDMRVRVQSDDKADVLNIGAVAGMWS